MKESWGNSRVHKRGALSPVFDKCCYSDRTHTHSSVHREKQEPLGKKSQLFVLLYTFSALQCDNEASVWIFGSMG